MIRRPSVAATDAWEVGGMKLELKPCPFCGSTCFTVEVSGDALRDIWSIECNGCLSRGPERGTRAEAEAAWNSRCDNALAELTAELRRYENPAKGKTCGTCRNFQRDPGRSSGRCAKRMYVTDRWGKLTDRIFEPVQSRIACKAGYEPKEDV